jgi:hypothetical protein
MSTVVGNESFFEEMTVPSRPIKTEEIAAYRVLSGQIS